MFEAVPTGKDVDMATHTVVYSVNGTFKYAPVTIIDGYTTVADIPKILAVSHINLHGEDPKIEIFSVFPVITQDNIGELNTDLLYHAVREGHGGKLQKFGVLSGESVVGFLAERAHPELFSFSVAL
jgi:hypothetical protein